MSHYHNVRAASCLRDADLASAAVDAIADTLERYRRYRTHPEEYDAAYGWMRQLQTEILSRYQVGRSCNVWNKAVDEAAVRFKGIYDAARLERIVERLKVSGKGENSGHGNISKAC